MISPNNFLYLFIDTFYIVLEYAGCVWDPHKQTHIDRLEKIQKRAARFITGNHKFAQGNTS